MNLIFVCVFCNKEYLKLLYLLLESIYLYGNLKRNIKILIYTSTDFKNIIKKSNMYDKQWTLFETNDNYTNVTLACKARLDLFELETIRSGKFNRILYLDTDILIKNDINHVFDLPSKDLIYAIEEGKIDDNRDYYGVSLFRHQELDPHRGKPAFSSGVMLFKNCQAVKSLFEVIKRDIINRPREFSCHDQPYIVYHAFRTGLFDNQTIKASAVNNDLNIYSNKTIHHFPGNTGVYYNKFLEMNQFLFSLKDQMVCSYLDQTKSYIDRYLMQIIERSGEPLEGNVLTEHETTRYYPPYENKAKNIISIAANGKIKNVLEIGFGSGFSSLLMLMANETLKVTSIDWMKHKYVEPCYEQIKSRFGDRIELIKEDSDVALENLFGSYDLIHIDGSIFTEIVESDILHSIRLSSETIIILDDYDYQHIHDLWNKYTNKYKLRDLDSILYPTNGHSIKWIPKRK